MNWKEILRPNFSNVLITLILLILITVLGLCSIDNSFVCLKINLGGVYIDPQVGAGPLGGGRQWGFNLLYWNVPSILILFTIYFISSVVVWVYRKQKK